MKKILGIAALLLLLVACNNEKEQPAGPDINVAPKEKALRDQLALHPDSLKLFEQLLEFLKESDRYEDAIKDVDRNIARDSMNPRLWDLKAQLHFDVDDTLAAIQAYERALDIKPDPKYISMLGSLYAQTRNPRALEMADALYQVTRGKAITDALFIRGFYYNYTGDKQQAISFFDQCLKTNYTYTLAYREKAIALYDLGKYKEALDVLDKGTTLQNNFDEGYYWAGRCLEKLGNKTEAIEAYQTALSYNKDYTEAREAIERLGVNK